MVEELWEIATLVSVCYAESDVLLCICGGGFGFRIVTERIREGERRGRREFIFVGSG